MENKKLEFEQFSEMVLRLFPELHKGDGKQKCYSRTVTFQVTDECNLACFPANTKILMADYTYKNIEDIQVGDVVMGFDEETDKGKQHKLYPTVVTHLFNRHDKLLKITDKKGGQILTTKNHPFLDGRGNWKRAETFSSRNKICKFFDINLSEDNIADLTSKDYMIGYTIAAWLGDGHIANFKHGVYHPEKKDTQSRLAQKDMEIIYRMQSYLNTLNIDYYAHPFEISKKEGLYNDAIYLNKESSEKLCDLILNNLNVNNNYNYLCGFLAGIYDTEGHFDNNANYIRIFNSNDDILKQCETALQILGYDFTYDKERQSINCILKTIRIMNPRNTNTILKLLMTIQPAIERKGISNFYNKSLYERVDIDKVEFFDEYHDVYNFETEAHTYIANNYLVHNCTYCYQINKGKRVMSLETAKKFVDLLLDATPENNSYINPEISPWIIMDFIGGEPFLAIDLIDDIMNYFRDEAFKRQHPWATRYCISICSNGTLYRDPKVQQFLNKHKNHLSFSVTIDGNKELHDSCRVFHDGKPSYDIAVDAATDWMKRGNYMGSKITIAPANITYLYDALVHMVELGYKEINANCVYEKGWEIEHAQELYRQMKKFSDYLLDNDLNIYCSLYEEDFFAPKKEGDDDNWCGGTGMMLSCDPDGYLYPCIRYMESSLGNDQPPIRIGHVDTGLVTTDEEKETVRCLNCITRRTQSTDECYYCPIAGGCSWCFPAGTKVSTPTGLVDIENISVGDTVLDMNGVERSVERTTNHIAADLVYVKAAGLPDLLTTYEHPFWCKPVVKRYHNIPVYGEPQWVKAKDLKVSDKIGLFVPKLGKERVDSEIAYSLGKSLNKKVPREVWNWDRDSIEYMLKGYFDMNGYFDEENNIQIFISSNEELILNISELIRGVYHMNVDILISDDIIEGSYHINYTDDYDEENNIMWVNVRKSNKDIPKSEKVYNISVSESPTFIANGALVHNCSAYNYQEFGTVDKRATYICEMHKARSLANVYYWNKLYQKNNSNKTFKMHCPKEWAIPIIGEDEYEYLLTLGGRENED